MCDSPLCPDVNVVHPTPYPQQPPATPCRTSATQCRTSASRCRTPDLDNFADITVAVADDNAQTGIINSDIDLLNDTNNSELNIGHDGITRNVENADNTGRQDVGLDERENKNSKKETQANNLNIPTCNCKSKDLTGDNAKHLDLSKHKTEHSVTDAEDNVITASESNEINCIEDQIKVQHICADNVTYRNSLKQASIESLKHGHELEETDIDLHSKYPLKHNLQQSFDKPDSNQIDVITATMGNQQAAKKPQSDDDTPDETKTQCCEIPKRKQKDRNSKISRSSKSDDNDFETNELYPFDLRSKSDPEILEPVDLDPFEIIETDDIKFVAGAGTSDVIKSASEAKFKAIPEEASFELEDDFDIMEQAICFNNAAAPAKPKELLVIDKGDRILESGTTTAHSTFEFKQVKGKSKLTNPEATPTPSDYANVSIVSGNDNANAQSRPAFERTVSSSSSSKEESNKSSKNGSRKNSKEAIVKPARQSKPKKKTESDKENGKKRRSKSDSLIIEDDPIELPAETVQAAAVQPVQQNDNHLILTQTMFVKTRKSSSENDTERIVRLDSNESSDGNKNKYENVGVCAKLVAGGISIGHKDEHESQPKQKSVKLGTKRVDKEEFTILSLEKKAPPLEAVIGVAADSDNTQCKTVEPSTSCPDNTQCKTVEPSTSCPDDRHCNAQEPQTDYLATDHESSHIYASLRPTAQSARTNYDTCLHDGCEGAMPTYDACVHGCEGSTDNRNCKSLALDVSKANQFGVNTESKKKETSSNSVREGTNEDRLRVEQKESVPPPSPNATMCILEEEEEEEEECIEEDNVDYEEEKQKSAEMVEFSENVCKRLSQLLENMETSDDLDFEEDEVDEEDSCNQTVSENVYETISDDFKSKYEVIERDDISDLVNEMKQTEPLLTSTTKKDKLATENNANYESLNIEKRKKKRHKRNGSSDTLKRRSNDTVIYRPAEVSDSFSSSLSSEDDGMPEYFDPRGMPPKRGSEILCDVLDAYADDVVKEVSAKEISDIANAHKLNLNDSQGNSPQSESKSDKSFRLPLQTFDSGLVQDVPKAVHAEELSDRTPTAEVKRELTALPELAKAEEGVPVQFETSGRQSVTCTESDLDISEQRDDISTDSMLADDEEEETMEILLTKTYTEPIEGAEVFLSCTVVNSAYKTEHEKQKAAWLSDEALEYFEANAANVMSTAFMKAKKEMKDIQICLQSLRKQMEHFHHDDCDDISLPDIPVDSLSPDYMAGMPRKAVTD